MNWVDEKIKSKELQTDIKKLQVYADSLNLSNIDFEFYFDYGGLMLPGEIYPEKLQPISGKTKNNLLDLIEKYESVEMMRKLVDYFAIALKVVDNKYQKAIEIINKTDYEFKIEPYQYTLAFAYFNIGNFERSIQILQSINQEFDFRVTTLIVDCFMEKGNFLVAEEIARNLLRKRSKGTQNERNRLRNLLGELYVQAGEPQKAINQWKKILSRDYNWQDLNGGYLRDRLSVLQQKLPTQDSRYIPSVVRQAVWRRDGGQCINCGATSELEFDHIIPHSKGGNNSVTNLQILCKKCNREKGANL